MPARTHRTEAAKKVGPRYHAPPGSSRPATDFRSSGNPFSSDKPWVATRKAASSRGFVDSLAASVSGKQVQGKATTGQALPPIVHSIKKSSQAKPSQRMTPTTRLDRGNEARGPHEVVHRTTAHGLSNRFHPTRTFANTPAPGSPSRRGRHHSAGSTPTRSPLRQVRRKTVSGSSSKDSHSSTNTTTINLVSPSPTPAMDDSSSSSSNVVCFEPDDRVTPNNLKRKLMTRPGGRPPRIVPGVGLKAARKTAAGTHFSTDDDDDIIELDSDDASQSDWSTSSDDTDQLDPEEYAPSDPSTSTAPPKELLEAFNKLTFHTRRMQQDFSQGVERKGRHTDADPKGNDEFSLEVVYRLDEGHLQYTVKGLGLFCPLCNLFGRFPTRETLAAHLEWDHTAVLAHWVDMATCWRVTITLTSNANIEEMEGLSLEDIPLEYADYEMDEPHEAPRPSVSDEAEASAVVAPLEGVALPPSIAPETPSVVQALDETQLSVPYVNVSSVPLLPPPTSPLAEPLIVLPPSPAPSARLRSLSPQLPPPSSPATNISDPVAAHPDASAAAPPHEVEPKTPLPAAIDLP
ncbi:hypothetical protein PTI98_000383 [Pleurotus ostreatus]|nr:hypothetical protein PTI98_000383 [Pleurotus ostreatus]